MHLSKVLSLASIAVGVLFYLVGVLGLLWPKSPPMDVGLVSTSAIFVLFGVAGLFVEPKRAAA